MLKSRHDNTIFMERRIKMMKFTTKRGEVLEGVLIRTYSAFEGGERFIFRTERGEYRCVKDEAGNYVEYVA